MPGSKSSRKSSPPNAPSQVNNWRAYQYAAGAAAHARAAAHATAAEMTRRRASPMNSIAPSPYPYGAYPMPPPAGPAGGGQGYVAQPHEPQNHYPPQAPPPTVSPAVSVPAAASALAAAARNLAIQSRASTSPQPPPASAKKVSKPIARPVPARPVLPNAPQPHHQAIQQHQQEPQQVVQPSQQEQQVVQPMQPSQPEPQHSQQSQVIQQHYQNTNVSPVAVQVALLPVVAGKARKKPVQGEFMTSSVTQQVPPMCVAEYTKFLMEIACPAVWLLPICKLASSTTGVVKLCYGDGYETTVVIGNADASGKPKKFGVGLSINTRDATVDEIAGSLMMSSESIWDHVMSQRAASGGNVCVYLRTGHKNFMIPAIDKAELETRRRAIRVWPDEDDEDIVARMEEIDSAEQQHSSSSGTLVATNAQEEPNEAVQPAKQANDTLEPKSKVVSAKISQSKAVPKKRAQRKKSSQPVRKLGKPNKPRHARICYMNENRGKVRAANPDINQEEARKMMQEAFKNLSPQECAVYDAMAAEEKVRYEREMAEYNAETNAEAGAESRDVIGDDANEKIATQPVEQEFTSPSREKRAPLRFEEEYVFAVSGTTMKETMKRKAQESTKDDATKPPAKRSKLAATNPKGSAAKRLPPKKRPSKKQAKKSRGRSRVRPLPTPGSAGKQPEFVITTKDWVNCDICKQWRVLPDGITADSLPEVWNCSMATWSNRPLTCKVYAKDTEKAASSPGTKKRGRPPKKSPKPEAAETKKRSPGRPRKSPLAKKRSPGRPCKEKSPVPAASKPAEPTTPSRGSPRMNNLMVSPAESVKRNRSGPLPKYAGEEKEEDEDEYASALEEPVEEEMVLKQKYPIGTKIVKAFLLDEDEIRGFEGSITEFDTEEGWYLVEYEDGDSEHIDEEEIMPLVKAAVKGNKS